MGALTITLDADSPTIAGNRRISTGLLTFSASYAAGGDTFDPLQMGLTRIDQLVVGPGRSPANTPFVARAMGAYPIESTLVAGGSPPGLVAAYAVPVPVVGNIGDNTDAGLQEVNATADLSGWTARFTAYGA